MEIPPREEYVGVVRQVVGELGAAAEGLVPARLFDLKVAVSEACTNAIEAQREAGVETAIAVSCELDAERLVVRIADHGPGLDDEAALTELPAPERHGPERGRGLPLMRLLVDEVCIDSSTDGTVLEIILRFGR